MIRVFSIMLLLSLVTSASAAEGFNKGPVFKDYGENVVIPGGLVDPASQHFKVVFDVAERKPEGGTNRSFNSIARFINMHVRAGVPVENIQVALVVHGKAGFDLMHNDAYSDEFVEDNASAELVSQLLDANVSIHLCGQSATFMGIAAKDVIPGVQMSLSAMTANALLQQQGYTLNPF
jgi:intracellular sulfur oxidation DsrE/DsrF family protein